LDGAPRHPFVERHPEATAMRFPPFSSLRLSVLVIVLGLGVVLGLTLSRGASLLLHPGRTTIDQSIVVERLERVAKLITTEAMVRDVVTYQNTWLGSTKRSLVIVTGKVLVGFDLVIRPKVSIQQRDRHIALVLPHARLLGVDVLDLKTYDERRGLWNPFHPADRDTIFQLARRQLAAAARDLAVVQHAEQGARQLLASLFAPEGYSVDVTFEPSSHLVPQ
jgi:hypothetical protein